MVLPRFQVYCKGDPERNVLGDCPFSQRVMLFLEEKGIPYLKKPLDEQNLPSWLAEVNPNGKQIPVLHDIETDSWIADSGTITDWIEENVQGPKLGTNDSEPLIGAGLFDAFKDVLNAKNGEDATQRQHLSVELLKLEIFLRDEEDRPFFHGERPGAKDCEIAPELMHIEVACKAHKNWDILRDYPHSIKYMQRMKSRPSWQNTCPESEDWIIKGWRKKMQTWGVI